MQLDPPRSPSGVGVGSNLLLLTISLLITPPSLSPKVGEATQDEQLQGPPLLITPRSRGGAQLLRRPLGISEEERDQ